MKPESIISLILVFSLVLICIGGIVSDMNNNYSMNVSNNWSNKYNFANQINDSASGMIAVAEKVGESENWIVIGLAGAAAIPAAVISTITLVAKTPFYLISMIRGVAGDLNLGTGEIFAITFVFIVIIIVGLAFALVRFIRGEGI